MKKQTTDEKNKCDCCGRCLKHPKNTTITEQFCHKCGMRHLANSLCNEPNEYFEQGRLSALANFRVEIKQSVRNLNKIKGSNWETFVELNRLDAWCGSEIARLHYSQPVSEETKFATSKKVAPSTGNSFIHESADIVDCSQQGNASSVKGLRMQTDHAGKHDAGKQGLVGPTAPNPADANANASYSEYHRNDAEGEGK